MRTMGEKPAVAHILCALPDSAKIAWAHDLCFNPDWETFYGLMIEVSVDQ
jgi:hypothetical protein